MKISNMKAEWILLWTNEEISGCRGVYVENDRMSVVYLLVDGKWIYESRVSLN